MRGKIWEILADAEAAERLNQEFVVSSMKNLDDGRVCVRIVSEQKPAEHAVWAEPELEDAFLYQMMC